MNIFSFAREVWMNVCFGLQVNMTGVSWLRFLLLNLVIDLLIPFLVEIKENQHIFGWEEEEENGKCVISFQSSDEVGSWKKIIINLKSFIEMLEKSHYFGNVKILKTVVELHHQLKIDFNFLYFSGLRCLIILLFSIIFIIFKIV